MIPSSPNRSRHRERGRERDQHDEARRGKSGDSRLPVNPHGSRTYLGRRPEPPRTRSPLRRHRGRHRCGSHCKAADQKDRRQNVDQRIRTCADTRRACSPKDGTCAEPEPIERVGDDTGPPHRPTAVPGHDPRKRSAESRRSAHRRRRRLPMVATSTPPASAPRSPRTVDAKTPRVPARAIRVRSAGTRDRGGEEGTLMPARKTAKKMTGKVFQREQHRYDRDQRQLARVSTTSMPAAADASAIEPE